MKYYIVALLLLSLILVSTGGFYDAEEISETVSVVAMGIDKGDNMNYRISFQIESINVGEDGKEAKNTDKKSEDVISVEAPTIISAYERANSINSLDLSIANVKMVIISEEVSKEGLIKPLKELAMSERFKNNSYLAISKGKAEDILKSISPEDEEYISVYYENIIFRHYKSAVREFLMSETYFSLIEKGGGDFILPLVSKREEDGYLESYKDDTNSDLTAGMTPKESKHKIEFLGGCVFESGRFKGYFTESEMFFSSLIKSFFAKRDISVEYPKGEGKFVALSLEQLNKSKIKVKAEENLKATFNIQLQGFYEYVTENADAEFYEKFEIYFKDILENGAEDVIKKCMTQYDADVFEIESNAMKNFLTNKKAEEYNISEKVKQSEIKVNVNLLLTKDGRFRDK